MQSVTFATTSTDTTGYTKIDLVPGDDGPAASHHIPSQALRIAGTVDTSGGTATIRFVLSDGSTIYAFVDVTFAASTLRSAVAGGSGNYFATVSATNADFIDLTGFDAKKSINWYMGCTAMSGSSVVVNLMPTRAT